MRTWIVAGNWKMNNTIAEAVALANAIKYGVASLKKGEVILAPPFTSLHSVAQTIKHSRVALAAQNMFYEDKGAFTGEVSPVMLKDIGCTYVIIGHSERRKYFHEKDADVNLKVQKALAAGLKPIMCVGETDEEREKNVTRAVVGRQVKEGLRGVEKINNVVIAYEPVWAIGTGKVATPAQAQEVHSFIRAILKDLFGDGAAGNTRILYGGSVTADNISELIAMEDIDGALVGGASLKTDGFLGIIKNIAEKK
ncbi:MAG TPA: triose-phosphate isomerase [Smithellaceae bacterium]|nr:triose-phosphate isomerase [Smithellaceae bacterium]HOS09046.1 triose-phosphate isomerase [Smithellaceae bacterium]HPM71200.1 triose-phosphate isomerase [Smithellaceae bacterium]HQK28410.1 triose-phosphate isomerase [Smithellaceae bacterium]HQM44181.1 triose-phosphate isomerase [Smithellaceae bacterium]